MKKLTPTFFFFVISLVSSQYSDDYSDHFVPRKPEDVLLQNNSILLNGTCLKLNRGDVLKVTINSSGPIPYNAVHVVFKEEIQHLKLRFEMDGKKLDDDECFIGEEEIFCGNGLVGSVATLTFLQIDPNLEMCEIEVWFLNETLTSLTIYDDETEPMTEEPVTEEQKVTPCNCKCECKEATAPAQSDEKQAASNDSEKLKGGPTMLLTSLFLCLLFARRFQ